MSTNKHSILLAGLINLAAFTILYLIIYPIYNSREDVFALYLLSGGFGSDPTEMLHYNHLMHPFLGWLIKDLFAFNANVNWYTLALVFAHYISCTLILATVIQKKNSLVSYFTYSVLFIVFEGYFLLYPDFTGSSLILAATGLLFLLATSWAGFLRYRHCLFAGTLFLLASFYRIHAMIPLAGIALPFILFTLRPQAIRRSLVTLLLSAFFIFLLNKVHQIYYKSIKQDWAQEEAYRQKGFRFFNEQGSLKNPLPGEAWYADHELMTRGMFIDTSFIPSSSLDSMYHDLKKAGNPGATLSSEWWKWFFINSRIFFGVSLVMLVLYGLKRKLLLALSLSVLLLAGGLVYLTLVAKFTPYLMIAGLSFICLAIFLYGDADFAKYKQMQKTGLPVLFLLLLVWGAIHLYRASQLNRTATWQFKQEYAEMQQHPDKLFIGMNSFHNSKLYAFDVPAAYPLPNYLYSEMFLGGIAETTMQQFGIGDYKSLFSSPKVLFWGELSAVQKEYFEKIAGRPLRFSLVPEFTRAKVWHISN